VTPEVRHDDPVTGLYEQGRDFGVAVHVVGEAVQEYDGARAGISDVVVRNGKVACVDATRRWKR
jgi:hypothetical protein